jgi:hypothetical protein
MAQIQLSAEEFQRIQQYCAIENGRINPESRNPQGVSALFRAVHREDLVAARALLKSARTSKHNHAKVPARYMLW